MQVLASIEYQLLKAFCKREKGVEGQVTDTTSYSKLEVHFGPRLACTLRQALRMIEAAGGILNVTTQKWKADHFDLPLEFGDLFGKVGLRPAPGFSQA